MAHVVDPCSFRKNETQSLGSPKQEVGSAARHAKKQQGKGTMASLRPVPPILKDCLPRKDLVASISSLCSRERDLQV